MAPITEGITSLVDLGRGPGDERSTIRIGSPLSKAERMRALTWQVRDPIPGTVLAPEPLEKATTGLRGKVDEFSQIITDEDQRKYVIRFIGVLASELLRLP